MIIDDCIPVGPFRGTVVCVGSGPSLSLQQVRHIGMARASEKIRVLAVNDAIFPCWFADIFHASDKAWWEKHEGLPAARAVKTCLEITRFRNIRTLKNTGIEGFDETPGCVRGGSNSGFQAVHLGAKVFLPKAIVLVGYDYTDDGARSHYFGKHEGAMDKTSNVQNWRKYLQDLTDELGRRNIKVFNATLQSTIKWLPRISLDSPEWFNL